MVEEIIKKLRAVKTMPDLEDMRRETLKAMKSGDHEVFLRVQKKVH